MGQVIVRPDATTSNTGAVTGTSAHAALADDSDSTFITYDAAEVSTLTFANPTIPSGARVVSSLLSCRGKRRTGSAPIGATLTVDGESSGLVQQTVSWSTAQNFYAAVVVGDLDTNDASMFVMVGDNGWILYEAWLIVTYVAKPTVNVTAPTGTLTDTTTPTVEWTNTLDDDGGPQTRYEVKVFTDAQYGAGGFDPDTSTTTQESGITNGADASWTVPEGLADDTYRAYVRVRQTVNRSDWDYAEFTILSPRPSMDALTLTPEDSNGRIKIVPTADAGNGSTVIDADWFEVERSYDGGTTYTALRTVSGDGRVEDDETAYDREAPNGTQASYRARAAADNSDGDPVYSDWISEVATWSSSQVWMRHPTDPRLDAQVSLRNFSAHTRAARQSVEQPLGRSDAVVVSDTRGPQTGTVVVACQDDDERDAIMDLAAEVVPVLLQFPTFLHEPQRWLSLGDEEVGRVIDGYGRSTERNATYSWTEVSRPEGDLLTWE